MFSYFRVIILIALFATPTPTLLRAQQTVVGTPFANASDSYYESFGTQWGVQGRGWFFNWGGGNAVPPFGGYDPNSGLQGGFNFGGNGWRGHFGFTAAQGSTSGFSSTSPMVVVPNGGVGAVIDTNYRPFVTEIVPVIGESALAAKLRNYGRPPYRLPEEVTSSSETTPPASPPPAEMQRHYAGGSSSATRGDASLTSIRQQLAAEDAEKEAALQSILAEAARCEEQGDKSGAASLYAKAAYRVEGKQRDTWLAKARVLRQK